MECSGDRPHFLPFRQSELSMKRLLKPSEMALQYRWALVRLEGGMHADLFLEGCSG